MIPIPAWYRDVAVGDVLLSESGSLRLVRSVHREPSGRFWLTFAIRRCSWTRRPTTTYVSTDSYLKRCERVARGVSVRRTRLDRQIQASLGTDPPAISCCAAAGAP